MKKQSTNLFTQICAVQVENLASVVKETLATGFSQPTSKIFTAADLWNIQRMGIRRVSRRTLA